MTQNDYYGILGIDKSATAAHIKDAYRSLAFRYHPDRNNDSDSAEKMKLINEAYAVLSHPDKRREYDMFRNRYGSSAYGHFRQAHTDQDIFRGSDINAIFEEMAKSFGFRSFDDIFKECYGNGYHRFEFKQPGAVGKGYVFFGKSGNHRFNASGSRNSGKPLGRLTKYLFRQMAGVDLPHNGADAGDVIYLAPVLATAGGSIPYHVRKRSKDLMVRIPPGTRDGQWIRLTGMGEEGKGGGKAGDLYLQVKIRKPFFDEWISSLAGLFGWFKSLWKRPR